MKNMIIRNISTELHKKIKIMAAEQGKPMQTLIIEMLEKAVKK